MTNTLFTEALSNRLRDARLRWIGAISFEERCVGSVTEMRQTGLDVSRAVLLRYPTTIAMPRSEDERRRHHHEAQMKKTLGPACDVSVLDVDPYSPAVAFGVLGDVIRASDDDEMLVVDVTCLTRCHVMGLAAVVASDARLSERLVIAYTSPRRYGALRSTSSGGWRETMILPLVPGARLGNAGPARGLVVLGHEADRLAVALSEFEPQGGTVVVVDWRGRPDFSRVARSNNRSLLEYWKLTGGEHWREVEIDVLEPAAFNQLVRTEAELARAQKAPVVLYPYGPKVSCLAAGLALAIEYPDRGWFAYPVPRSYDIDHSYGVGRTRWFDGSWTALAVPM